MLAKEFSKVTIIIEDKYVQTRMFISHQEFKVDLEMSREELEKEKTIPKYKSTYKKKYDMYNCIVEDSPFVKDAKPFEVGGIFYYWAPYNGGRNYKIEILKIEELNGNC